MKGDTLADKINLPIFKNDKNEKYPHLKLVISPYEMIARTAFSKFTECTRERIQGFEYVQSIFWSKFKIESDKSANRQLVGRPKHSVWLALSRQKQDNVLNLATNTLDADETKKNEAREKHSTQYAVGGAKLWLTKGKAANQIAAWATVLSTDWLFTKTRVRTTIISVMHSCIFFHDLSTTGVLFVIF